MTDADLLDSIANAAAQLAERDRLICQAVDRGIALRTIAAAAGVSHPTISRIAKKENTP